MSAIVLATNNAKKAAELAQLFSAEASAAPAPHLVRTLKDVGVAVDVDETGDTFAANAKLKAEGVLAALPEGVRRETFAVVADDSGLVVDALDGKPGVRSARFAPDHGYAPAGTTAGTTVDDANNALLLALLPPVPDERRTARFACAVHAIVVASGAHETAFGTVEGHVARALRGAGGFGYDPLFLPVEAPGKTMAELSADEKHAISHRGRAMRALVEKLRAHARAATATRSAEAFVFKRATRSSPAR